MQIALCDDETAYHETIQELIGEYKLTKPDRPLFLSSFCSGKELLNHVDEYGGFDLYILDCIMPGMDGIETGCALRERDEEGIILYLTTSPDFALDSYKAGALNYLLKPVCTSPEELSNWGKDKFFQAMDKAYHSFLQRRHEVVSVKTPDGTCIIAVSDIRYVERTGKQLSYYLADNKVIRSATFNGSFKSAISELLAHKGMLLVGSSFAVNLSHVTEVRKYDLILTGNVHIPVPQRLYETVKTKWADFWLEGGRYHAF